MHDGACLSRAGYANISVAKQCEQTAIQLIHFHVVGDTLPTLTFVVPPFCLNSNMAHAFMFSLATPLGVGRSRHLRMPVQNLVDPASSHMLVSKIKPCMSQYKPQNGKAVNGSLKQL